MTAVLRFALVSLTLNGIATAQAPATTFSLTISSPQPTVRIGEEVPLNIVMTNTSGKDIHYGQPLSVKWAMLFDVHILDSANKPAPETPYGRQLHGTDRNPASLGGSVFSAHVGPGKTLEQQLMLNKEYEIGHPGKYTIQAERVDAVSGTAVKSNTITLTVVP